MPSHPVPPDEQIVALLTGGALRLALRCTGKTVLSGGEYPTVFTVQRADISAYVTKHGVPSGAWSSQPGSADGLYMVETEGGYEVYIQERGVKFDGGRGSFFTAKSSADAALVDYLLAMSGCGLFPLSAAVYSAAGEKPGWLSRLKAMLGLAK